MNSNTTVGRDRCSRLIKQTLVRRKSFVVVHFIMQPTAPLQRTADKATSKDLKFYFLENNRVQ